MEELTLNCAIVDDSGRTMDAFDVKIRNGEKVSALKEVVKTRSDGAITVPSTQLQLFLAKTEDGVWLPDDVALDAIQQSGDVPPSYTKMRGSWKLSKLFKSGLSLEGEVIHVLAVIPKGASPSHRTLGLSMEALEQNLLDTFEWREPKRLCGSAGSKWPYQGIADVDSVLMYPLVEHYEAWQRGSRDKQTHPIFLALSGPGTGKSRMLDEMQTLLKEAAKQANNQDLVQKMENACVFRMSFEYDTPVTKRLLDVESADVNISYRMLYQLAKERKDWSTHVVALKNSLGKLPLTIGKVLEFVAKLKKMQDVEDMTVISCVDGLQHVENDDFCTLSRIVKAICCFLNSSRVFTVWVCSATAERSVSKVLGKCTQQRVYLLLPPLRGHEIITPKTEMEKQLVDDMGGHGRALEILQEVLEKHRKVALADVDPAIIVADVYREFENRCNIFDTSFFSDPTNCQEVLTGILSRRKYYMFELIGQHTNMTVDWLQNIGFIRYTPDKRLECAFIILMMLMKSIPKKPGDADFVDDQIKRLALGWQPFEQFVAFHRRMKSIAFSEYPVLLSEFHAGARFGAIDWLLIHEKVPRTVVKAVSQLETKSGSKDLLIRTEHHGSVDISTMSTVVVNADHAAAGDIFMRVHLTDGNRQIHSNEVIQCKFTERNQKIDRAYYEKERTKAVNNASDVFLLIAPSDLVEPFDLRKRCGIVSKAEFNDYFGPFASRAYRSLFEAPDINNASYQELRLIEGVGDAIAAKIIAKRNRKRFSSHDDAIERLFKNKKSKTADILRELNCSPKVGQ